MVFMTNSDSKGASIHESALVDADFRKLLHVTVQRVSERAAGFSDTAGCLFNIGSVAHVRLRIW